MAGTADVYKIEVAFTTAPWATTPTWTDVTALSDAERALRGLRGFTFTSGSRQSPAGGGWTPAQLTAVFGNGDADWDQANSGSAFGVANLKRNKKIRLRVSDDDFTGAGTLFVGYIDDIQPVGDIHDGVAVVTASDISRLLAEYDVADLVRPAEFTGVRAAAILDAVGVPAGERGTVQNGSVVMPAATLASDAWSLLSDCARAEGGQVLVEPDGDISFYERGAIYSVAQFSTRQHSFTADGNGATSAILQDPPLARTLGAGHNITRVTASRASGSTTYEYETTGTNEPPVTLSSDAPHGLLATNDAFVEFSPHYWHKANDFDGARVGSFDVHVYPGTNGNALTALEAGDYQPLTRVLVQSQPSGFGSAWDFEAHVEQYVLEGTPDELKATVFVSPFETQLQDDAENLWYEFGTTLLSTYRGMP